MELPPAYLSGSTIHNLLATSELSSLPPSLVSTRLSQVSHPRGGKLAFLGFDWHLLVTDDCEHFFHLLISHSGTFFGEMAIRILRPFNRAVFLVSSCESSLHISDTSPSADAWLTCPPVLHAVRSWRGPLKYKFLTLTDSKVPAFFFLLSLVLFGVLRNHRLIQSHENLHPCCLLRVLALMFMPMIRFN